MAIEGLSARIYLDHNMRTRLATELRAHGYDTVHAQELGLAEATDEEHLRIATSQARVLVPHDLKDFRRIAREWANDGTMHSGIILAHQPPILPYPAFVRRLLALLDEAAADDFVNLVRWV